MPVLCHTRPVIFCDTYTVYLVANACPLNTSGRPDVEYPVSFSVRCRGVDIFLSKISSKCSLRGNQTAF